MSLIQLRPAGPNEHRCIIRQALGYYRSLVIGGLYTASPSTKAASPIDFRSQLTKALKHAVSTHPILSAVILDEQSEHPRFAKPSHIDLTNHIVASEPLVPSESGDGDDSGNDWRQLAKPLLVSALDTPFDNVDSIPPWKVYYARVQQQQQQQQQEQPASSSFDVTYVVLFAYDHSHGDGMSALAFHRTLLAGLELAAGSEGVQKGETTPPPCPYDASPRCPTTSRALLPTVEAVGKLSVSPSYLLSPLLGSRLPRFLAGPLGLRATATPEAPGSWRGNPTVFFNQPSHITGVAVLALPAAHLAAVLRQCRRRDGVKLTGLLHQLIVRALSHLLPDSAPARAFVSQSAVDLRRSVPGLDADDMAVCVTGYYEAFPRVGDDLATWGTGWTTDTSSEHPVWTAARTTTAGLAAAASTTRNQPVGLLRFLSDFRAWTASHIGKPRDASYEISNLTAFDPKTKPDGVWDVAGMLFAQPANVTGGCFDVNVVSRTDGDLAACLCWQRGAIGVDDEDKFMETLTGMLKGWLMELAEADPGYQKE